MPSLRGMQLGVPTIDIPDDPYTTFITQLNALDKLAIWDAGAGVFSDAGITPAINGALVAQLNDQSSNGLHLSQSTDANKMTYRESVAIFNGRPTLECTTAARRMTRSSSGLIANRNAYGIALVLSSEFASAIYAYSEGHDSVSTQRVRIGKDSDGSGILTHISDSGVVAQINPAADNGLADGAAHILYSRRTASNAFEQFVDGVSIGTVTTSPGATTVQAICLGAWYVGGGFSSHWAGHIAHCSIYASDVLNTAVPLLKAWYNTP